MSYSDDMYSGSHMYDEPIGASSSTQANNVDDGPELDEIHILSPSDGYFGPDQVPGTSSASAVAPSSSHVPDVWVSDPSLDHAAAVAAESKVREAAQESSAAREAVTTPSSPPSGHQPLRHQVSASAGPPAEPDRSRTHSSHSAGSGRQSTQARYTPPTTSNARSASSRRDSIYSEPSSHSPSEAPPAYTPSPTSPSSASGSADLSFARNYRTFPRPAMGHDEERRGLLASDPQSMGGGPDDPYPGAVLVWRERVRRRMPLFSWRNCRTALLVLVLLLVTLAFLTSPLQGTGNEEQIGSPKDGVNEPASPDHPGQPDRVARPKDPPTDYPRYDEDLAFTSSACAGPRIEQPRQTYSLSFSPTRSFSFEQKIDRDGHGVGRRHVHISGDVVFRRDGAESSAFTLEMIANHESISVGIDYDAEQQSMIVTTPGSVAWDGTVTSPCIAIRVTVWVPPDGQLDSLYVDNVQLGIKLLDNLSIRVAREIKLRTIDGQIASATSGDEDNQQLIHAGAPSYFALDSRSIDVKTISGPIKGCWPLHDLLYLQSVAGNIVTGIEPKPSRPEAEVPASLFLKTVSGNIEAWQPVHAAQAAFVAQLDGAASARKPEALLPPRDYLVNAHSISGRIKGALAVTRSARIVTISGAQAVDLLPVLPTDMADRDGGEVCDLATSTTSGATVLRVLKPLWVEGGARFVVAPPTGPTVPTVPTLPEWPTLPVLPAGPTLPAPPVLPVLPRGPRDVFDPTAAPPVVDGEDAELARRDEEERRGIASFLRVLSSHHMGTSATIHVEYPGAWEGGIELSSNSGSLEVTGKDVRVIRQDGGWPGDKRRVVARKGNVEEEEGSQIRARTTSGNIRVEFPT